MKIQSQYDVIVLGNYPAALLAGAFIAQKGFSVLISAPEDPLSLHQRPNGQYFDPEPNQILGFGQDARSPGLLTQLLQQLKSEEYSFPLSDSVKKMGIGVVTPQ